MFSKKHFSKVLVALFLLSTFAIGSKIIPSSWLSEKHQRYTLYYTSEDSIKKEEYCKIIDEGVYKTQVFFNSKYKNDFAVYIHPDRNSLDQQWRKDWKDPKFKSECWMVASGIATKLDMIAPVKWDKESCEHKYKNTLQTKQLIAHELVHVYHGQQNVSPDFSTISNLDWFVEGLATYASGQCDSTRMADVKKAIENNEIPDKLNKFWTGKIKYGLSGSVVMYMDKKLGREKMKELLKYNKGKDVFKAIGISEEDLIANWKKFMLSLAASASK